MQARDAVAGKRERERGEELSPSSSTGALTSVHVSVREAPALRQTALHRREAEMQGLQGLDGEPALERPLPERDAVPGRERGPGSAGSSTPRSDRRGRILASSTTR